MQIIILAAGKGSRMNSNLPKVMHKVGDKPMLEHVINNCSEVTDDLILVYSEQLNPFLPQFQNRCKLVNQSEQLGTAHAVAVAKDSFAVHNEIAVIYGDNPFITPTIIRELINHLKKTESQVTTLAFEYNQPNQYGRIVTDQQGNFLKIVEAKFADRREREITLCNSGIMAFAPSILEKYIDQCLVEDKNQPTKELYLTRIIEICAGAGEKVSYYKSSSEHKLVIGVNTREELLGANLLIKQS